jgi:hypothetical protein
MKEVQPRKQEHSQEHSVHDDSNTAMFEDLGLGCFTGILNAYNEQHM